MAAKKCRCSIKLLTCPECGQTGTLRKILYGMPDPETFDFEKYVVSGCCMNGDRSDPNLACKACSWRGIWDLHFGFKSSEGDKVQ